MHQWVRQVGHHQKFALARRMKAIGVPYSGIADMVQLSDSIDSLKAFIANLFIQF